MRRFVPLLALACLGLNEPRVLRVCADPAALPYSNDKKEGFENRIAEILARELGANVEYTWFVQRRGFLRNTLNAGTCDVVMAMPVGNDMVRTTKPYYRSTFVFVAKQGGRFADLSSLDDARLHGARIGVPLAGEDNPPIVHALARRGLVDEMKGYHLYGELGRDVGSIVDAVAKGDIDVGVVWGPIGGYGVKKRPGLVLHPIAEHEDDGLPFTFAIALGVRRSDKALAQELDAALVKRRDAVRAVLRDAAVPMTAEVDDATR